MTKPTNYELSRDEQLRDPEFWWLYERRCVELRDAQRAFDEGFAEYEATQYRDPEVGS